MLWGTALVKVFSMGNFLLMASLVVAASVMLITMVSFKVAGSFATSRSRIPFNETPFGATVFDWIIHLAAGTLFCGGAVAAAALMKPHVPWIMGMVLGLVVANVTRLFVPFRYVRAPGAQATCIGLSLIFHAVVAAGLAVSYDPYALMPQLIG
jgi:hypothetical protein